MSEQFIITGTITPPEGVDRTGISIQAFDRDMPSLERRAGSAPQMLGEAIANAEGRFQITYTLEQFSMGEGVSQFRRLQEKNADLSFRIFDRSGQELTIKSIEALNRGFGPTEIIFNAPTPLDVNILLEAPLAVGISEYEQLTALIAPVLEDLALTQLLDEDIVFLVNELGLEQQRQIQQHIHWLRDSALLSQETNLPTEAFYGWARTSLPDLWNELLGLADENRRSDLLTKLLNELVVMAEDVLVAHLLRAIEENIISARLRERASAIAYAIRRRVQKEMTIRLRLEREPTGALLAGYSVTVLDADANNRDLGTDVTDALGEFVVSYHVDAEAGNVERNLHFRVRGPSIAEAVEVSQRVQPNATTPVSVRIALSSAQPTLQQLHQDGHIDVPDGVLQTLEQTAGIRSLADIRRRGGLSRIEILQGIDASVIRNLDAFADLDRLSSDLHETSALIAHKYDSVVAIADTPRSEFVATMSATGANLTETRATELHVAAKGQTDFLAQVFAGIASDFANGFKLPAGSVSGLENLSSFSGVQ